MADANPFLLHRQHLDVYRHALVRGLTDADYEAIVVEADDRVAAVDGTGFLVTPVVELRDVPDVAAPVIAKIETGNVGGSHKARHLFGLLLNTMIDERAAGTGPTDTPLAIASCGNAALGAAVVARAGGRTLQVFVPTDADPAIVARLGELDAEVQHCERRAGEAGDPCVLRLHEAIATGARPFTVQGPVCPEVIDGCRTLGLELAGQLDHLGVEPRSIYVQIGGGALATAVMDGLGRAWPRRDLPALHPVQARSAHPYVVAWRRFASGALDVLGLDNPGSDEARASLLAANGASLDLDEDLAEAHDLMVPWPGTPASVASGILDDVTYDWQTVLRHQIETGGYPILVDEETFVAARELAATQADPPPDETGSAGLAGLLTHAATSPGSVTSPSVVLLTG